MVYNTAGCFFAGKGLNSRTKAQMNPFTNMIPEKLNDHLAA